MAVTKTSFLGSTSQNGVFSSVFDTQNALFLKLFAGEVLTAYETATVMKPLHMIRTINSGKSAQFPVTGTASAKYHKPGTDVLADNGHDSAGYTSAIKHNERIINIDDLLIASTFIDRLDEMKNHYDVRSIYSTELGRALARTFDKNLLGVACLTAASYNATSGVATATSGLSGNPNGTIIAKDFLNATSSSVTTKGDIASTTGIPNFKEALYEAAAQLDKNNVPSEDRFCIVTPTTYYRLINSATGREVVNRDFGGGGSYQDAQIATVAGIRLIKSNIAPDVFGNDLAAATGANNTYTGNFLRVVSMVFHKSAFGTVKLQDLAMESGYDMRLQGNLMIAKYAMGSAPLRPECAVVLAHNAAVTASA